jgi:hypothetical protein
MQRIIQYGALVTAMTVAGCHRKAETPPAPVAPVPQVADSIALAHPADAGDSAHGETMPQVVPGGRSADSAALVPLNITLAAIGYRNGIVLVGTSTEATIAIPVNDGLRPDQLKLHLITTPLMPAATLVIRQRDRVLAMRALTDTSSVVILPLANAVVVDGKATFNIGLTVPGPDLCQAARFYRTVLAPESQVVYAGTPHFATAINGFFQPWLDHVTFYVADHPSLDAAQAALDASAYVARRYRGMATTFDIKPLPAAGTPLPEPGPWSRAIVWSPTGSSGIVAIPGGRGTMIAIAARRDARQLFTLRNGAELVASGSFRTASTDLSHDLPGGGSLRTLADLGFDTETISGNSQLSASYPVSLADLGTNDAPTSLRLIVHHSTLPVNGNGSMRLHLNGDLIYSRALEHDGFDAVIPIPAHLLRRDNVFDVRFQVTLGEGACLVGAPDFTATIDNGSAFVVNGGTTLPPGFDRFPQAFVPAFSVLLDPVDRYRVELATTVIDAMQQTTTTPLAPSLARDQASAVGPLLAIGTTSLAEALDAPLQTDGVRLRDATGKVWDEFAPGTPYGAMQGWERHGTDVLLIDHTGADGQTVADLLHETLQPYGWFGVRGDLAIRGLQGPTRVLTVNNGGWRVDTGPGGYIGVIREYQWPLLAIVLVIFLVAAYLVYPRVVRSELDTTR